MFDKLYLHDASLRAILINWEKGACILQMTYWSWPKGELVFTGFSGITVPREEPWGASVSVNSVCQAGENIFEIEMQSGDVIRVVAAGWTFNEMPAFDMM